jgi:hypothetical protein
MVFMGFYLRDRISVSAILGIVMEYLIQNELLDDYPQSSSTFERANETTGECTGEREHIPYQVR